MRYFSIFISLFFAANVQAQSIPSYLPTSGLVAWYPFNGNANDESGNGNDGTNHGASLTTDRFGNANSAFGFDGSSSYISYSQRFIFNQSGDGALSIWFKNDSVPSVYSTLLYSKLSTGDNNRFNLYVMPRPGTTVNNFTIDYREGGGGLHILNAFDSIVNSIWQHIVISRSSNNYSFYLNGDLVNSVSDGSPSLPNEIGWLLGRNAYDNFVSGKLDDIAIYNRALSASEVTSIYNSGATVISGAHTVCLTTPSTYTSSTTGGTWSVIPSSIGTISASGLFTPSRAGGAIIRYNVGTTHTDFPVTVYPNTAPTTSGDLNVCVGGTTGAYSAYIAGVGIPSGGSWSSSNPLIATIDASTKRVSGVSVGSVVLTYTFTDACGTFNSTRNLQVASTPPNAGRLTGSSSVVAGNSIVITESAGSAAGRWSTSDASIASIGTVLVTSNTRAPILGISAGTATITYTVTNACGSNRVTKTISVTSPRDAWAQESGVKMYPNPTTGMLNIEYAGLTTNLEIEMVDMTGKVVYAQATEFEKMSVDVRKFTAGTYLVRIKANGEQSQQRVVVE